MEDSGNKSRPPPRRLRAAPLDPWAELERPRASRERGEEGDRERRLAAWEASLGAAVSERAAWYVAGLGIDPVAVRAATSPEGRRRVWRALEGVVSPRGVRRADAVLQCGRVCAAVERERTPTRDAPWRGVAAARWCRDRLCPVCAATRASSLAAQLRTWVVDDDPERIGRTLFVTATQPRRDVLREPAGAAVDRLLATWRELTARGRPHASVRRGMAGWVRAVEVTYSTRRTAESRAGWHAHIHALVELDEGVDEVEWRKAWVAAWCAASGASPMAQDVRRVDESRIGQVCKYPLSPFSLTRPAQIRAAAEASVGRRMLEGGGAWRSWQRETWRPPERELHLGREATMDALAAGYCAGASLRIEWLAAPKDEKRRRLVGPAQLVTVEVPRERWESEVRTRGKGAVRCSRVTDSRGAEAHPATSPAPRTEGQRASRRGGEGAR